MPEYYAGSQGRKNVEDAKDLGSLMKNPNKYAVMIVAVLILAVAILAALLIVIIKLVKRAAANGKRNRKG